MIPYIGNKRKLLGLIQRAIAKTDVKPPGIFLDLFAGSGVVSRMAKRIGFRTFANDWEPYVLEINRASIDCNRAPDFMHFGGYANALALLNALPPQEDWITRHLCPVSDTEYDILRDRLFYTRANGGRIDAMRCQIECWEREGSIDPIERACLLAPMLYKACYTSNTSGVFKGFHNGWGGQTGTALYRILSDFAVEPIVFYDNTQENAVYRIDCLALANRLHEEGTTVDIAYLDPPYNQHPYGSNYHVLNTIALWDRPALTERIEGRNKSAIREDWRTLRRSAYNHRANAATAYSDLMTAIDARYILTSYSTDGSIPLRQMVDICIERGATDFVLHAYKRYRVSSQRYSAKAHNIEFVLIVDTGKRHTGLSAEQICSRIAQAESLAISGSSL